MSNEAKPAIQVRKSGEKAPLRRFLSGSKLMPLAPRRAGQ
ncbi:hypothetical protein SCH4B_4501 [Ruegeria sp. TrichCH4B]|nr:hypothetical protein SCH4B_4501 [Ruegeria sp. TrichCH4B]